MKKPSHLAVVAARWLALCFCAVLATFFLATSARAFGDVPKASQLLWVWQSGSGTGPFPSDTAAINSWIAQATIVNSCGTFVPTVQSRTPGSGGETVRLGVTTSSGPPACTTGFNANYATRVLGSYMGPVACPADSTPDGTKCVCNLGFKPIGGQCVAYTCADPWGPPDGLTWSGNTGTTCYQGCNVKTPAWSYSPTTGMSSAGQDSIKVTGTACQGSGAAGSGTGANTGTNTATKVPPIPCAAGTCAGTVNGALVCVPCSFNTAGPGTTSTAPPGGTASAPPIPNAPPGATGSSSSTSCVGGTCTTTTTFTGGGGVNLGSTTKDDTQANFCKDNPNSPLCKDEEEGSFGGTCAAFTCKGDAVQCAIAKEQHVRNCTLFETSTPLSVIGNAAASGEARPAGHPGLAGASTSLEFSSVIDQTNRIGGGCPADVSFSVAGASMSLPLSQLCTPLSMLGGLMVGLSMLAAAFIVFRG